LPLDKGEELRVPSPAKGRVRVGSTDNPLPASPLVREEELRVPSPAKGRVRVGSTSAAIFRIDFDVIVRQVGSPNALFGAAATEVNADHDFFLAHDCLSLLFGIGVCTAAVF